MAGNLITAAAVAVLLSGAPLGTKSTEHAAVTAISPSESPNPWHTRPSSDARFAGSGVLAHGPQTCTMFHADTGESFALGNLGGFWVGDRVYVTGPVVEESLLCWPHIVPAIERNTICAWFEGSGVLARGPQGCFIVFHADTGEVFALGNLGDFTLGDRVYVTGPVVEESLLCWPHIRPAIERNTICAWFEGSGVLGRGPQSCIVVFYADAGETFALDNVDDFWWGDRVYVTGPVNEYSWACWPTLIPAIEDNTIEAGFKD